MAVETQMTPLGLSACSTVVGSSLGEHRTALQLPTGGGTIWMRLSLSSFGTVRR